MPNPNDLDSQPMHGVLVQDQTGRWTVHTPATQTWPVAHDAAINALSNPGLTAALVFVGRKLFTPHTSRALTALEVTPDGLEASSSGTSDTWPGGGQAGKQGPGN